MILSWSYGCAPSSCSLFCCGTVPLFLSHIAPEKTGIPQELCSEAKKDNIGELFHPFVPHMMLPEEEMNAAGDISNKRRKVR